MQSEVSDGPSSRRHVLLYCVAIALQYRERALWTILKDRCEALLKQYNLAPRCPHLCDGPARHREIHSAVDWRSRLLSAANKT
jgi:hypothetical protein